MNVDSIVLKPFMFNFIQREKNILQSKKKKKALLTGNKQTKTLPPPMQNIGEINRCGTV